MKALTSMRGILKNLSKQVEVLPAIGGAIQDLEHPDFEEREDMAMNEEEKIFDAIHEYDPSVANPPLFRFVQPLMRGQNHFYRYFLDGSFRSYFLGTMLEHERETPVLFAQVGACLLHRKDDGSVCKIALEVRNILTLSKERISRTLWNHIENLIEDSDIKLVDLTEQDIISKKLADFDLRNKAAGKICYEMHLLESEMINKALPYLSEENWMIIDGSLLFSPTLYYLRGGEETKPVVGVSKSFRKDPQFVYGRGPKGERKSIFKLLSELDFEHRTAAFKARNGEVVFWYVRLREQKHLDYPIMGIIKGELANPSKKPIPSELLDIISQALVAERSVTPHGQDRRWHVHLYPIFLAECAVKESLLRREVVQQFLKWR